MVPYHTYVFSKYYLRCIYFICLLLTNLMKVNPYASLKELNMYVQEDVTQGNLQLRGVIERIRSEIKNGRSFWIWLVAGSETGSYCCVLLYAKSVRWLSKQLGFLLDNFLCLSFDSDHSFIHWNQWESLLQMRHFLSNPHYKCWAFLQALPHMHGKVQDIRKSAAHPPVLTKFPADSQQWRWMKVLWIHTDTVAESSTTTSTITITTSPATVNQRNRRTKPSQRKVKLRKESRYKNQNKQLPLLWIEYM